MRPDDQSNAAKRIAFVLPDLRFGGVERLTIDLTQEFLDRGFRVDLVLMQQQGEFIAQLPQGARLFNLGAKRGRHAVLPLRRYIRDERPDAVCAAIWSLTVIALIASLGIGGRTRIIVAEHCPLVAQYRDRLWMSLLLRISTRATFWLADGIVGVSNGVSREVARLAGLDRSRVTTIYNPVKRPACSDTDPASLWGGKGGKRILSVGKLKKEKNFPTLISAFATLARERDAVLAIVGEGEERASLEQQIRDLGLEDRVLLPGLSLTPGDWYTGADLFVLASEFEGFALVLLEAMHFGLPVVSTDCPYGPAEALGDGRWGRLTQVGDPAALAQAMAETLDQPADPDSQRRRAAEFSLEKAATEYAAVLFGNGEAG